MQFKIASVEIQSYHIKNLVGTRKQTAQVNWVKKTDTLGASKHVLCLQYNLKTAQPTRRQISSASVFSIRMRDKQVSAEF